MTRAKRNILILGSGILAILLMIVLIFLPLGKRPAGPADKLPEAVVPSAPVVPSAELSPEEKKAVAAKANAELEAKRVAQIFTERYGSFTNQGDFENVADLYPLMTANMRRVSDAYISEQELAYPASSYYGVTAKALSAETVSQSAGKAVVSVRLQKGEVAGAGYSPKTSYVTAQVSLVKLGETWKVDDVDFEQ